jgi:hypothetical protein
MRKNSKQTMKTRKNGAENRAEIGANITPPRDRH